MTTLKESGNFHYKNRNFGKAIEYYLESLETNPNQAAVYHNLAMSHFQLQHYQECLKGCTEALRLDPKYKKALFRRMHTHAKLGNFREALVDGHQFLQIEDPKEESYAETRREMVDYRAKLTEDGAPPDGLKLSTRKRSAIPQYLLDIRNNVKSDAVGLLYLRESLKKVMDGLSLLLQTEELSQLEEIKLQVCLRLLELETPENCIDLIDIILPLQKNPEQKVRLLRQKIEAAKKCKSDHIALMTLRELNSVQHSEAVMKEIAEFEVATDSEDDKKEEEEKCESPSIDVSGFSPNHKLTGTKQDSYLKNSSIKQIKSTIIATEQSKQQTPSTNNVKLTESVLLEKPISLSKQPTPPLKKATKQEQTKQPSADVNSPQALQELQSTIREKIKHLEKHRSFEDYVDLLEKLQQYNVPSLNLKTLQEISQLSCFKILKSGLTSVAEKQLIKRLISGVPADLAKLYQQ